jgi:hypothetical protein
MEKALKKVNVFYRSLPVVAVEGGMILYGRFTGDWTWAILGAIGFMSSLLIYIVHLATKQAD